MPHTHASFTSHIQMADSSVPFRIDVPEAQIEDLRSRLQRTRWPIEAQLPAWEHGTSLPYMQQVANHWLHAYDWRLWEAHLNSIGGHVATIDEQRVHYLLELGSGPSPPPLLLTHGWPGSVAEFLDVIGPLAHPERHGGDIRDAFTVIAPSLPGYGFSGPPSKPISHRQIAGLWHRLMEEVLGIRDYVAQGGDVGSVVTSWLAKDHPEFLRAIHLNYVPLVQQPGEHAEPLDADEKAWMAASALRRQGELAYQQIQGTKPQTLSYGLTDSPIGLAAWILEKFQGWTLPGERIPPPFGLDHLLTNVMLHWLPGPNAAMWTYRFAIDEANRRLPPGERVEVPTGVLLFPQDLTLPPPDHWIRRAYHMVHRTDAPRGGHFAAFENPALFIDDVRKFFRSYRAPSRRAGQ